MVEPCRGKITIDGINLSSIGLDTLRQALSAIPQETILFSGTMRENLDPEGKRSDAELNDALRRCGALGESTEEAERFRKFKLDAMVLDEGSNYS
jgi:ATP-binding cassette subfamily C (CFTR/MRP) protein 1